MDPKLIKSKFTEAMSLNCSKALHFILCSFFLCILISKPSIAGSVFATDACDSDYMESMKARAWLEAQRENTQHKNLIFKPDSVLEYTCFNTNLNAMARFGGPPANSGSVFTNTNRWGSPPGDLTSTLDNEMRDPLWDYLTDNYSHTYLGGRMAAAPGASVTGVVPGSYVCNSMNVVWQSAKCMDFINNSGSDSFFTFDEYEADPNDKRVFPAPGCTTKTANFQYHIDRAIVDSSTPWEEDTVITYFDLFNPGTANCGGANSSIPTGLRIVDATFDYLEHICLVPGCFYTPTSLTAGTCDRP